VSGYAARLRFFAHTPARGALTKRDRLGAMLLPLFTRLGRLDDLWELLRRIQEWLTLGGIALAALVSLLFLGTWVAAHLRRPGCDPHSALSRLALVSAYLPVALTFAAALGVFVPALAPLTLRFFAIAVVLAALSWCLAAAALIVGGTLRDLARARRAILLAGTPWYCLVAYLAARL